MENQTQKGKGIYYYYTKNEDKHYFGSFLNLANNNIEQIIEEFRIRLSLKDEKNIKEIINNYFTDKKSYTDWERGINILKEYLPVIDYLDLAITDKEFEKIDLKQKETAKRKYFRTNFSLLIDTIIDLRNFYTHYFHKPISINPDVAKFLDKNLLNVCLDIKKQKMKTDKTKQALKDGLDKELKKLIELKKAELKEKKIKTWNITENVEGAVYNDAFNHMVYKNNAGVTILKDYHKSILPDDKIDSELKLNFSISGLVFLLSMFLSKKEIEQFKSNLEGFKGKVIGENGEYEISKFNNSLKYMATHWIFSYLTFKGLKQRVKNTFDKETLLMQMIDELNKVPHEVYQTLSKEQQNEFLEDINEYVQDNEENKKSMENSIVVHPVIRKRYDDKFNYFAIRFLDEFANFPTLKFFVTAGNFVHDKREKQIQGSMLTSDRMIKEKINVFGKLTEIAKYKSDYFSNENTLETSEWELFPNPSYLLIQNNIPVHIDLIHNTEEAKQCQIAIDRIKCTTNPAKKRNTRKSKEEIIKIIYQKNKNIKYGDPTALLSSNELPALIYELLVNKKSGKELENIIVEKIVNQYKTIAGFEKGQNLSNSLITKKLKKSEPNEDKINAEKIILAINRELEITENKLNIIKNNRAEFRTGAKRKHIFYSKELGQEATWIAYDLKRFMPEASRKEWKGFHHSELQKFLAFYDRNKNDAKALLNMFWNFDNDQLIGNDLNSAFREFHFDKFYEKYLIKRDEILEGFKSFISNFKDEPKLLKKGIKDIYRVFDKRYYIIKSTNAQKEQLLSKPICLPRGIFDNKPTYIEGVKVESNSALFADWYQYTYSDKHEFQSFYDMPRDYKEQFEKFELNNIKSIQNKKNLNKSDKFIYFRYKQDLKIKQIKSQDLFIKLMVDELFNVVFKNNIELNLKKLYQTSDERFKNQLIADVQKNREKGDTSDNKMNENFIWNMTIPLSLCNGQIEEPKVKLKDIGKFRKLETDDKVIQLLEYDKSKVWKKLEIEDELENMPNSYERIRREKLLKGIQEFEHFLLEKEKFDGINHPKHFEQDLNPNFKTYVINGVLRKNSKLNYTEIDKLLDLEHISIKDIETSAKEIHLAYFLIHVRNKFGHNQLPKLEAFELMKKYYKKNNEETYAEYFHKVSSQIVNEFKNSLEKHS
ncbi:MAG: hypothetical protein A2033_10205 [Bacteroidetes bacterium GWA2_31_9]|nr:MAG: hypothetical protein A2033_10205 [Bacteroidetes bacterium GWA2_31_9]